MINYYVWKTRTFSSSRKAKAWAYHNKSRVMYRDGKTVVYTVQVDKES